MTGYRPSKEEMEGIVRALRYVLWRTDHGRWIAAGGDAADAPPCPVTVADLPDLANALAAQVVAARGQIATGQFGITDPAEVAGFVHGQLQRELESAELNARFADIDAEARG
jgi:hypothetical protein